jgi:hypothetical protein
MKKAIFNKRYFIENCGRCNTCGVMASYALSSTIVSDAIRDTKAASKPIRVIGI